MRTTILVLPCSLVRSLMGLTGTDWRKRSISLAQVCVISLDVLRDRAAAAIDRAQANHTRLDFIGRSADKPAGPPGNHPRP